MTSSVVCDHCNVQFTMLGFDRQYGRQTFSPCQFFTQHPSGCFPFTDDISLLCSDALKPRSSMLTMTIHELLADPVYRSYFCRVPRLPPHPEGRPPWRLFVQLKGEQRWRSKNYETYAEAFKAFNRLRKEGKIHDAAINCRRASFPPPVAMVRIPGKYVRGSDGKERPAHKRMDWKPLIPEDVLPHDWCPWCRRPTVFRYFSSHHALNSLGMPIDSSVMRCHICGASTRVATYRGVG